jgi:hypothetical protein
MCLYPCRRVPAKYIHTSVDAAAAKDKLVGTPPSLLAATGRMAFAVASGSAKGVGARVWRRDHYTRQLFYAFYAGHMLWCTKKPRLYWKWEEEHDGTRQSARSSYSPSTHALPPCTHKCHSATSVQSSLLSPSALSPSSLMLLLVCQLTIFICPHRITPH